MIYKALTGAIAAALFAAPALAQQAPATTAAPKHINRAIETLESGKPVFGLFTGNFSLANARALARSGLDFIFIDMEHTAFNIETLQQFLIGMTDKASIARNGNVQMRTTPIVRIPPNGRNDPEWVVKQVLDAGAFGVMFPYVDTPEQAQRAVVSMRYPQPRGSAHPTPVGRRGSSPGVASWFWGTDNYTKRADVWPLNPDGELLTIIQIETAEGYKNAEAIITTPGVSAVFIGPADLSMSMGLASTHAEVQKAIDDIIALCNKHKKPCGITTGAADINKRLDQGFKFPTVGYWGDDGIAGSTEANLKTAREHSGRTD